MDLYIYIRRHNYLLYILQMYVYILYGSVYTTRQCVSTCVCITSMTGALQHHSMSLAVGLPVPCRTPACFESPANRALSSLVASFKQLVQSVMVYHQGCGGSDNFCDTASKILAVTPWKKQFQENLAPMPFCSVLLLKHARPRVRVLS